MHESQKIFCESVKKRFPRFFKDNSVLEIGSLDINGNNRYLFKNCKYTGLDVVEGKGVDFVCIAHEYAEKPESFDVVFSTNALEHDMYYPRTLRKMIELVKPEGLMFFSTTSEFQEHGTLRTTPGDSGTSQLGITWGNYFKNLHIEDIENVLNLENIFKEHFIMEYSRDLYFWGIKKKDLKPTNV